MIEKKKILMIGPSGQGGIASVIDLYKETGLCKDVIFMSSYKASYGFINLVYFPLFLIKYLLIILKKNIKLVHIHSSCRGSFLRKSLILYIAKLFKKKTIFHIHGADFNNFYDNSPNYLKKMISNVLNRADLILALSGQWKKNLIQRFPHSNVEFLYNPAYIKVINGYKDNEIINVLFMGILDRRKGIYDIIEAAKYINNDKVKINLFGNGNLSKIKNIINKNNLENKISVNGWINAPKKLEEYAKADIFILPSFNEGLPMSILEAMIYKLPIISTPVGGIPEAVKDGINGFLITAGDYRELATKIDLLAGNKELREQMGEESYKIAKEKFDINMIIEQLSSIYKGLLGE